MPATLRLLGPPRIERGGELVTLPPKQSLLLGAYLAFREDWVPRSELLTLFWPDDDDKTARHNLSQLLYHSKRQPWFAGLETERARVRWAIATDVRAVREALGNGAWGDVVDGYAGTLLEGVEATSVQYEDWLMRERQALFSAWRDAALHRARALAADGDAHTATVLLERVLGADPLAEDAVQAFMRIAAETGRRDRALRAYEAFARHLADELDVEPLDATRRLAEAVRATRPAASNLAAASTPRPRRGFPGNAHAFVGRELERAELSALVRDGARLVTLLGPGGIGKTRLAQRVADDLADRFGDGAVYVPLAPLDRPTLIAPAVLRSLGLEPSDADPPERQLRAWLASRSVLVVLDNAEHLIDGLGELREWLDAAPALRVLVTSRVPLELPGEAFYRVEGLATEAPDDGPSDAVALLLQAAHRTDARFRLAPGHQAAAGRLARALEGMPLALELAAPWLIHLSPDEVREEIGREASLLTRKEGSDAPERHRSVTAVFEHSWNLLSDPERRALARMSVFNGGAERRAAESVAGADLRTLLALVTKSLLRRDDRGRFVPHVLVRQLAQVKLDERGEAAEARAAHAAHVAAFVAEARPELRGEDQAVWLARLAADHGNLRAALRWFAAHAPEDGLFPAAALFRYFWLRGHYREGLELVTALLERVPESDPPNPDRVYALQASGNLMRLCSDYGAAVDRIAAARDGFAALGDRAREATATSDIAMIDRIRGRHDAARAGLESALEIYRELGDRAAQANALNNLAAIAMSAGDDTEAEGRNRESLELAREVGDPFVEARALGNLGGFALERGDLDEAESLHRAALDAFEAMGYPVGIAVTQHSLGSVAAARGDVEAAFAWWRGSLLRFREIDDRRGVAELLIPIGRAAAGRGDFDVAARFGAASEAIFEAHGVAPMPHERSELAVLRELADDGLGAGADAPRLEGATWDVEAAASAALAYLGAAD